MDGPHGKNRDGRRKRSVDLKINQYKSPNQKYKQKKKLREWLGKEIAHLSDMGVNVNVQPSCN